jgi:hypothetical protein
VTGRYKTGLPRVTKLGKTRRHNSARTKTAPRKSCVRALRPTCLSAASDLQERDVNHLTSEVEDSLPVRMQELILIADERSNYGLISG